MFKISRQKSSIKRNWIHTSRMVWLRLNGNLVTDKFHGASSLPFSKLQHDAAMNPFVPCFVVISDIVKTWEQRLLFRLGQYTSSLPFMNKFFMYSVIEDVVQWKKLDRTTYTKEVMQSPVFVCLSVCLTVTGLREKFASDFHETL